MLNAEKYKEEIMNNCKCKFGFSNRIVKCEFEECPSCSFSNMNNDDSLSCTVRKVKWLLSEHKEPIKLSRLEYEILERALNRKNVRYIVRDSDNCLMAYGHKPDKGQDCWKVCLPYLQLRLFNDLFQFVQWEDEQPTSIKDVLDNCEVVNDAKE